MLHLATALTVFAAVACSKDNPTGHEHADVFRVALVLGIDEIAATGHLPITHGEQNRVQLHLYDEHGGLITDVDHFQISLAFTPETVASATPVTGTTTFFDITSSQSPDTEGSLMITIYHPHTETTKTFGPYAILIH